MLKQALVKPRSKGFLIGGALLTPIVLVPLLWLFTDRLPTPSTAVVAALPVIVGFFVGAAFIWKYPASKLVRVVCTALYWLIYPQLLLFLYFMTGLLLSRVRG